MLNFFRLNDPYRLFGALVVLIVLCLPIFIHPLPIMLPELKDMVLGEMLNEGKKMYAQIIDDVPWLMAMIDFVMDFVFARSLLARHILAILIIFFQASLFARALIRHRAYGETNHLPALVFVVLSSFSFELISLSHQLIASTFLLLAMNKLFKEMESKNQRDDTVLNMGMLLGLSSLVVVSYSIFLIGVLLLLLVFGITFRKALLLLFGFAFPHMVLLFIYYFTDTLPALFTNFYLPNFTFYTTLLISWKSMSLLGIPILVFGFISFVTFTRIGRFTKYQSRLSQVMLFWIIIATTEIAITRELSPSSFITFIPSLSYFISHFLLLIHKRRRAELTLWILLLSVVGLRTASHWNKIPGIDYSGLFVPESKHKTYHAKRILILGNDWGLYKNNKAASCFLNWNLSKDNFEHPDYFENVLQINDAFAVDAPDVIIDDDGWMKNVFARLPQWATQYKKEDKVYWRKLNSKIN